MSWTGKLERADFGPGAWILHTDGGKRMVLYGEVPASLNGQRVTVEGKRADGMGIAMTGDAAIEVSRVTAA